MCFYYYILIGTAIISVTYADAASNQAVSSQSYDRGDIPLSYKHNLVHVYTSPKPYAINHGPHEELYDVQLDPKPRYTYQRMQYAPLPLKNSLQYEDITRRYTEAIKFSYNNVTNNITEYPREQTQKKYIEPLLIKTPAPEYVRPRFALHIPNVAGHNVIFQAQAATKNKRIQNGLHANNPNLVVKNKQVNVNYPQHQHAYPTPHPVYSALTNQYMQIARKYNEKVASCRENADQLPTYKKAVKVELNVARVHNIAQAPLKASVDVKSNFKKIPSLPQEFFFQQKLEPPNIQLKPAQKRNTFFNYLYRFG